MRARSVRNSDSYLSDRLHASTDQPWVPDQERVCKLEGVERSRQADELPALVKTVSGRLKSPCSGKELSPNRKGHEIGA